MEYESDRERACEQVKERSKPACRSCLTSFCRSVVCIHGPFPTKITISELFTPTGKVFGAGGRPDVWHTRGCIVLFGYFITFL